MSLEDVAPIAEAKENGEPPRAPIRLMTQFLKAVSESRMEDALALAQTSRKGRERIGREYLRVQPETPAQRAMSKVIH